MISYIESDAAYIVSPKACSHIVGFFYFSNKYDKNIPIQVPVNDPMYIECRALRRVVTSAPEVKPVCLFFNAQVYVPIKHIFNIIGNHQPPTPINTDNYTVCSFLMIR